jgi:hypothetical protein
MNVRENDGWLRIYMPRIHAYSGTLKSNHHLEDRRSAEMPPLAAGAPARRVTRARLRVQCSHGARRSQGRTRSRRVGRIDTRIRRRELLHIRLLLKHTLRRLPALRLLTPNPNPAPPRTRPLPPSAALRRAARARR